MNCIPAEMPYVQGYCCFAWTITKFHSDAVDGHVTLARFIKKRYTKGSGFKSCWVGVVSLAK